MGVARQSRRSSVLAECAHRINRMSTHRAVLVPCAQLRTNDPASWRRAKNDLVRLAQWR